MFEPQRANSQDEEKPKVNHLFLAPGDCGEGVSGIGTREMGRICHHGLPLIDNVPWVSFLKDQGNIINLV
jgi:hypothetical protein